MDAEPPVKLCPRHRRPRFRDRLDTRTVMIVVASHAQSPLRGA